MSSDSTAYGAPMQRPGEQEISSWMDSTDHQLSDGGPSQTSESGKVNRGRKRRASKDDDRQPQRAAQACTRCRRMKLRCVGGIPCTRCTRAVKTCEVAPRGDQEDEKDDASARLAKLEQVVAGFVGSLSSGSTNPAAITQAINNMAACTTRSQPSVHFAEPVDERGVSGFLDFIAATPALPQLDYYPPYDMSMSSSEGTTINQLLPNPPPRRSPPPLVGSKPSPESRLALAQAGSMSTAPFRPLLFRPGVWDNREQSRPGSPQSGAPSRNESWTVFEARAGPTDDPVSVGDIDLDVAAVLVDFFLRHCHPFIPVIDFTDSGPRHLELRQRSAFLYTTVIAIAARLYSGHIQHVAPHDLPQIDHETPAKIRQLAYSHLAATMMRKEQSLPDVQATLILSVWGLMPNGKGPDPWLLTGHCHRMGQRLGVHKAGSLSIVSTAIAKQPMTADQTETLDKALSKWKTSLSCYHFDGFLSLGFGRPLSVQQEPINEELYMQAIQARHGHSVSPGDVYTASLVQLSKIGREMISWIQVLSDRSQEIPSTPSDYSICTMLRELNKRLDSWSSIWTWNGSLYAIQMGPSSRLAKLQAEHVRLCLNSMALKPDLQEVTINDDAYVLQDCVRRASEAAINMIQLHYDASQSDHVFSYSFEFIFNALAQAAVFLVRLYLTPPPTPVEKPVLVHFIRTAIDVIEKTDFSVTGHSTKLAKICRELCQVAGVDIPPRGSEAYPSYQNSTVPNAATDTVPADFNIETFLQLEGAGWDLGMMLGLPNEFQL